MTNEARADYAYDSFIGPGFGSDVTWGDYRVGGYYSGPGSNVAVQFVATESGYLSTISAAIIYDGQSQNEVTLSLLDDSNGQLGSPIASWTLDDQMSSTGFGATNWPPSYNLGDSPVVTAYNKDPSIYLDAGDTYWLYASFAPSSNTLCDWLYSWPGALAYEGGNPVYENSYWLWYGGSSGYYSWMPEAFDVQVNSSPVPSPAAVLTFTCLGLGRARRRWQKPRLNHRSPPFSSRTR